MKKFILIMLVAFLGLATYGQRTVFDTLNGNETVAFDAMLNASSFTVLCTQLGGTSDGTVVVQGSVDGVSYETLQFDPADGWVYSNTDNDTLTVTSGAIWVVDVTGLDIPYFRVEGAGTASDTTLITIKWSK